MRKITCIICPRGCSMEVKQENGKYVVCGNTCPRGEEYAINECTNPLRTVTSVVRVANLGDTMVSVKTEAPIPKGKIFEVMDRIRATEVTAPVRIGDVIIPDIYGTKVIATKNIG